MKEDIKTEWVKRLREPERQQVTGFLEVVGKGQCCLGVLAEIAAEQGAIKSEVVEVPEGESHVIYDGEEGGLNEGIYAWAGIDYNDFPNEDYLFDIKSREVVDVRTEDKKVKVANNLAELNDYGYTFAQIADVIEKEI